MHAPDRLRARTLDRGQPIADSATDEACVYLEHPLFADDGKRALPEIMKTSFCGRFPGRWVRKVPVPDDNATK